MSSWPVAHDKIKTLITKAELEAVEPNPRLATGLVEEAQMHMKSVAAIVDFDYPGAFQLGYDAARKACVALLAFQGLRSTYLGGHIAVADAVRAQFNGPHGSPAFLKMHGLRQSRAGSQYPRESTPPITRDDANYCRETAQEIITAVKMIMASEKLGPFKI
jgi:hypothetical protein